MEACAILFLGALLAATPFAHASCYTPPGVLGALVDEKRREVDRMRNLPEAREDGPWFMRLHYPANAGSYVLGRTLGWKRERPTVLVDLKRASPTGQLDPELNVAVLRIASAPPSARHVLDCWGYCCSVNTCPELLLRHVCGHRMQLASAPIRRAFETVWGGE